MAIKKQFLKSKPLCKVTFAVPAELVDGAKKIAVVGEFNEWDATATLLKKQKTGEFKTTIELPINQEVQFRYVIDDSTWLNDEEADKFVPSGISSDENGVVVL
ncbi:MAG: isoamylase early set domain-containing protein [Spirosomataceae bacterium]